jgi:uracil-DNA glycosylase
MTQKEYIYENVIKKIKSGWLDFFDNNKERLENILEKVNQDLENNIIFPFSKDIFRSLFYFEPTEIKLVLLGQDPYINSEIKPQACGLSFSVPKCHKKIPPSLVNIYKEIKSCYPETTIPKHGSLRRWAKKENILLLNSALTVIKGKSNSHQKLWGNFTDDLIKFISEKNKQTIFLLMGNFAIKKSNLIDTTKHKIFTTAHPSPLSAYRFFGCNIFKEINNYLESKNIESINWFN